MYLFPYKVCSVTKLSNQIKELDDELTSVKKKVDESKSAQERLNKKNSDIMKLLAELNSEMEFIENQVNWIRSQEGFGNVISNTSIEPDLISSKIEKTVKKIERIGEKGNKIETSFEFIYAGLNRSVLFIDSETLKSVRISQAVFAYIIS